MGADDFGNMAIATEAARYDSIRITGRCRTLLNISVFQFSTDEIKVARCQTVCTRTCIATVRAKGHHASHQAPSTRPQSSAPRVPLGWSVPRCGGLETRTMTLKMPP